MQRLRAQETDPQSWRQALALLHVSAPLIIMRFSTAPDNAAAHVSACNCSPEVSVDCSHPPAFGVSFMT